MSVSCDGQLILILALCSLDVYTSSTFRPEGAAQKPLLIVQLPSDIKDPRHAVQTPSGYFIILHSLEQRCVVSKVTGDGRFVVRRFIPQNETQRLTDPRYLTLDSNDRVFVSDVTRERVILLNSDLTWIPILRPVEDEVNGRLTSGPNRLCYDKAERQLIVDGDGVDIYTLTENECTFHEQLRLGPGDQVSEMYKFLKQRK